MVLRVGLVHCEAVILRIGGLYCVEVIVSLFIAV